MIVLNHTANRLRTFLYGEKLLAGTRYHSSIACFICTPH